MASPSASKRCEVQSHMTLIYDRKMVGVARIELATPAMSTQCSTTELHAHSARHLGSKHQRRNPLNPALKSTVLIFRLEDAIDLRDEVLQMEGL